MTSSDPSVSLLAACGGDTIKLFDPSDCDSCKLSFSPSPGIQVNSVKWNHTNLVVASAGDDWNGISLLHKNGRSFGTLSDSCDKIKDKIQAISFSNKSSRYICTGGSARMVKIWDLKRKWCSTWMRGHVDTITGAMYNCEDEHLASISLSGDVVIYNVAYLFGEEKLTKLKDPNEQALRVLDYSRTSRHLLVTAGDDGSVHLWDTSGSAPKVSWSNQHTASTTGVSFSPSNDKIIASVGLDKKLYILDSASRTPTFYAPYGAPFSSLAFRDDGWVLAAGTNDGQIIFFDVRGRSQPFSTIQAYSTSESVRSLCWQRSKPITVNENSCNDVTALLGEDEDSTVDPKTANSEWWKKCMEVAERLQNSGPSVTSLRRSPVPIGTGPVNFDRLSYNP